MSEFMEDFCPYCGCHHKTSSKVHCALNRALNKVLGENL